MQVKFSWEVEQLTKGRRSGFVVNLAENKNLALFQDSEHKHCHQNDIIHHVRQSDGNLSSDQRK